MNIGEIENICKSYRIENYSINDDGSIDVDGSVYLTHLSLESLSLVFNIVAGNFSISSNQLTTLKGCPSVVGGFFDCSNNTLTSLEHCPIKVGVDFDCSRNVITSLEHCPIKVGGDFDCYSNVITSLEHCPSDLLSLTWYGNLCPGEFNFQFCKLSEDAKIIFIKYQNQFEVWYRGYNHDNVLELIEEINNGLL